MTNESKRDCEERGPGSELKLPYEKPVLEPAGSVFSRTKALGSGSKDGINGSVLL